MMQAVLDALEAQLRAARAEVSFRVRQNRAAAFPAAEAEQVFVLESAVADVRSGRKPWTEYAHMFAAEELTF